MPLIFAGAEIGGLAAALCLHEKGFEVQVFELAEALRPLGVGINIMPHGAGILHNLGLGEALDEMAIRTRAIEYQTRYGHLIRSDPRSVEAGFEYPQYRIEDLIMVEELEEVAASYRQGAGFLKKVV